jgi:hypothetical protein
MDKGMEDPRLFYIMFADDRGNPLRLHNSSYASVIETHCPWNLFQETPFYSVKSLGHIQLDCHIVVVTPFSCSRVMECFMDIHNIVLDTTVLNQSNLFWGN